MELVLQLVPYICYTGLSRSESVSNLVQRDKLDSTWKNLGWLDSGVRDLMPVGERERERERKREEKRSDPNL